MLRDAVESRYRALIADQLKDILGSSCRVEVIVGAYVPPSVAVPVEDDSTTSDSDAVESPPPTPAPTPAPTSAQTSVLPIISDDMLAEYANQQAAAVEDTDDQRITNPIIPANDDPVVPEVVVPSPKKSVQGAKVVITTVEDESPVQSDFFVTTTRGMLNPRFTFDRFIIGSSNRLASAACMAVADHPAQAYNPLFLYGGVGLGKTHLLHAIGNAALERDAEINVLYVSSEKFTNDLINAIRRQQTEEFRIRYRNIDILLIDDIQFIAGKDATQEEFFHTFNTLHTAGKQVVMTSDRPPKAILTLEERLRSRFEWGLIVDIQMPDYETRTAILRTKAEQLTVDVPANVIDFLAQRIQSNIRELEGSLNRVVAYAKLNETAVTIESAQAALSDWLDTSHKKRVTPEMILRTVCEFYGVELRVVQGRGRSRNIVGPRQVAMYLLREETDASLVDIGAMLGGRDHTTVMYGCDKIAEEILTDNRLKQEINTIRERLYQQGS
jgi:chromosomal replication initiator protein